jgi:hypothetical protein
MSRFRISKANALGDLFLYDNIGQTRLVLSQDANELRQLLNEHFGVTECAPCKAIHHLHTEPPLDPCFMCGGLPCRCDEPASELDQDGVRRIANYVLDPASVHRFDEYIVVLAKTARAWLRIQEAAEQEERGRQKFYDDMRAFGEVRRARRERITELAAKVADELIRALEEED